MSTTYVRVSWNRQKRRYDTVVVAAVLAFVATFVACGLVLDPRATAETLLIRAFGACAFVLLHVVLAIGPLCRLDRRFLPLLYNRRHLGVVTFVVALAHGVFSAVQFHAFGDVSILVSLWSSNTRFDSLAHFPFQQLGFVALSVLFVMAATSHDFWLKTLSPRAWKTLHMGVYVAWALVVMHVAVGAFQTVVSPLLWGTLLVGTIGLAVLHGLAARAERRRDAAPQDASGTEIDVGPVESLPLDRGRTVVVRGERVALFRHAGGISAVSNVCRHQNGPLGEGRIIDGCITCPWHGYQYRPHDGTSPPPFTDRVPTYRVRVVDGRVRLDPRALPAGTPVPPAHVGVGR
ncbi:MAG: ferric reductase-like transmembrane domain-containing protein [Planctomycetes bacterium]|nr:ferric reductase-like transmembrane domain-containing protein [Planctomycetota bacterium]